jgi:transposase
VDQIDAVLRGGGEVGDTSSVEFLSAQGIGGFWAAYCIADQLGIIREIGRLEEKYQFPILCMVLDRVVQPIPHSKLSLWESLAGSALEQVLAPDGKEIELHDVYDSLEALYANQTEIQKSLYKERETTDCMYLYDITSSYFEGTGCSLAKYGYNRDGKNGKLQIVIGLLTDSQGRPLAIKVFEGNTTDQATVMGQIDKMRKDFGIKEMIFIGDRGMVTRARREDLSAKEYAAVRYVSALKRQEFMRFVDDQDHPLQLSLFDREGLVEVEHEGVRYVLSFNPEKELEDRQTRLRLIEKTQKKLEMIQRNVKSGRLKQEKAIARKFHTWANKWNMERFFVCNYSNGVFVFRRDEERIKSFEAVDGFYVITSDVPSNTLDTAEVKARYKSLSQVEQAFRTMKTTDLFIRPIRHWNPDRVRGHVFVCMLSYLVIWKARQLFTDFISKEPVDEVAPQQEDCHSLRVLWERLNQDVQIAQIRINSKVHKQLNPLNSKTKKILAAANATITPEIKKKLLGV